MDATMDVGKEEGFPSFSSINKTETMTVVGIAILAASLSELSSYLLFFRRGNFQELNAEIVEMNRRILKQGAEKEGSGFPGSSMSSLSSSANSSSSSSSSSSSFSARTGRSGSASTGGVAGSLGMTSSTAASSRAEKKVSQLERELARKNRTVGFIRQKANFLTALVFMLLMPSMYSIYDGQVLAKLPFEPIFPFCLITHATLAGNDYTECSYTFLFTTTMFLVKTTLQKLLGYSPPSGLAGGPTSSKGGLMGSASSPFASGAY